MQFDRLSSFLISLSLHLGVAALILWWPASAPPPSVFPGGVMISELVTIGAEGDAKGAKREIPQAGEGRPDSGPKSEPPAQPQPPAESAKPEPAPPQEPAPTPEPEPAKATPQPEPGAVAIPPDPTRKPPEKKEPEKKPPPPKEPEKKEPAKKEPEKKEPEKKEAEKKPPEKKQPEKKQPEKAPARPDQKAPAKKSDLDSALADLNKQAGKKGEAGGKGSASAGKGSGQNLSNALADLGKQLGGSGGGERGRGPGGSGGDGMGVLGSYTDSIISRVRPNWSWPGRTDRKNFTAVVNIKIDASGEIKGARVVSSSGNAFFDATVMRAVAATERLEPPPSPELMDIDISFTPEALGGR